MKTDTKSHIQILIADMAIVWRAWALWTENRLIKWSLLIILLADIGSLFDFISLTYILTLETI